MSRTWSGISIRGSAETSWAISAIGKSGARSAGPIGWPVPGCSTGGGGEGRPGTMLYQWVGRSRSSRRILVGALLADAIAGHLRRPAGWHGPPAPVLCRILEHVYARRMIRLSTRIVVP